MKNYYKILGLNKEEANDDDIKKSYRKLAMQYHPDRGGDEEKFKEISEAYAVLSDKEKKKSYDFTGQVSDFDFSVGDIFNSFFEKIRKPPLKSEDRYIILNVKLEEVMNGSNIKFRLKRKVLVEKPIECPKCDGTGYIHTKTRLAFSFSIASSSVCRSCKGSGLFYQNVKFKYEILIINLDIAPGTPENHKYFFPHLSDEEPGYCTGDLYFIVKYEPHPDFIVDDQNLIKVIDINMLEYLTGFERIIHHLNHEKIKVKFRPLFPVDTEFCIKGLGLLRDGDLILKIKLDNKDLPQEAVSTMIIELSKYQTKELIYHNNVDKIFQT